MNVPEKEVSLAVQCQDGLTVGIRLAINQNSPEHPPPRPKAFVNYSVSEFGLCPESTANQGNPPSYGTVRGLEGNQNRKQSQLEGCPSICYALIEHQPFAKHSHT